MWTRSRRREASTRASSGTNSIQQEHFPLPHFSRYNGEKTSISSLCKPDALHRFFAFKGLTGQREGAGLASLIDDIMEKHNVERTKANMLDLEWEILNYATELSDDC